MSDTLHNFNFIELTAALLEADKPFDGMVAGEFTDMLGRSVKITADKLTKIAANTTALLETTKDENGVITGLPIDEKSHEKGHASGWIVGVELVGEVLRIIPQWTEIGRNLITKKIQRYFSATVDLANDIIHGGTLTNWPATRDKSGRVLLRPIELSQEILQIEMAETPTLTQEHEVMKDEVKAPDQEALLAQLAPTIESLVKNSIEGILKEQVASFAQAQATATGATEAEQAELSKLLNLDELNGKGTATIKQLIELQVQTAQKNAEMQYMKMLAQANHQRIVAELAQRVTGGTAEAPRGLPVQVDQLEEALLRLPKDQYPFWSDLCQTIVKNDLIEFTELGHGKNPNQGTRSVEPAFKTLLSNFIKDGGTVDEFFAINAEFMAYPKEDYNLSEFVQKEK